MTSRLNCTSCDALLPDTIFRRREEVRCSCCGSRITVYLFPAMERTAEKGQAAPVLLSAGEAGCFYHPGKQALRPCDECGRFLCSLCDLEVDDQHICPGCLSGGKNKSGSKDGNNPPGLVSERMVYDRMALALAVYPIPGFWLTVFTAPAALYLTIRHYRSPGSLLGVSKFRFWMAGLFSSLQIIGWLAVLFF